ncbi:MAG: hypothetical protein ACFE0I_18945 [Elainellaceae cyanobacterium]
MPISDANQGKSHPVQTKIWIFAGQILAMGSPKWSIYSAALHPQLVGYVESDSKGQFAVELSPGEYTVFLQKRDNLYLNVFSKNGCFVSIKVHQNKIQDIHLTDTEDAVF